MRIEIIVSKHKGDAKPPPKHQGNPAPETPPQQPK